MNQRTTTSTEEITETGLRDGALSIRVREPAGLRRVNEPVTTGVPLPRRVASANAVWTLTQEPGGPLPCQTRCLSRWPDGSAKWLQVTFLANIDANQSAEYILRVAPDVLPDGRPVWTISNSADGIRLCSSADEFSIPHQGTPLLSCAVNGAGEEASEVRLEYATRGQRSEAVIEHVQIEDAGPVRVVVRMRGRLPKSGGLLWTGNVSLYASRTLARLEITLHNPSRARHAGGYWDLDDPATAILREVSLKATAPRSSESVHWIEVPLGPAGSSRQPFLQIHQESSGGENWYSRNHVDRDGRVPLRYQGFQGRTSEGRLSGLRASPVVAVRSGDSSLACSVEEFWQKFPTALEVDDRRITAGLWPESAGRGLALQGGERCTRVVWFDFRNGCPNPCQELAWTHEPLVVELDSSWMAESQIIHHLPSPSAENRRECRQLLESALSGPSSFFAKREVIDEYGWRNFGDAWGDHEEAHYTGPKPVISHYNNQYDLLHGLLLQFLLTGDGRWWKLADPMARHILDVDTYHTEHDKSAYNGGLFWHTAHYHDAATCTHRTYSRAMVGQAIPAPGGGPANEHNYTTGLLLYHWLTGNARALDAVVGLADWVVAMDDGSQHLCGLVSDAPTGAASCTRDPESSSPGRGVGNSINALVDGWLATDNLSYLVKAEELIRRTIHPRDELTDGRLLDAENHWSYTVQLQALGRFCSVTSDVPETLSCGQYSLAALLHYARWMARHERLYLDHPERLEYPTETWAAQDLRKGNVLLYAALLANNADERALFRRRGEEILDGAWRQLMAFETRSCTRPLALVLQQGYIETYLRERVEQGDFCHATEAFRDFGEPQVFVSQKQQVRGAMRSPIEAARMLAKLLRPSRWMNVCRRSWTAQRLRLWKERWKP